VNLLLVLIGFAGIAAVNLPGLIKKKQRRDLAVYSVVFVLVLALGVLAALGVDIPSPIKAIQAFYRDVLHLTF